MKSRDGSFAPAVKHETIRLKILHLGTAANFIVEIFDFNSDIVVFSFLAKGSQSKNISMS